MKETNIQQLVRLAVSESGGIVFRNNVGKLMDNTGRWVTYGLCVGSSDLIGWYPVTITPDMVGQKAAIFTAIEIKTPGKSPTRQQENFIDAVNNDGGIAFVATSEDDVKKFLKYD